MKSKIIKCRDFGDIKIQEYTKAGQIEKYYKSLETNEILGAEILIADLLIDKIDLTHLSTLDKIDILDEVSKELEVGSYFNEKIKDGVEYSPAFSYAFQKSTYYQSILKAYKELNSILGFNNGWVNMNHSIQKNYSALSSVQNITNAITKYSNPLSTDFSKITQISSNIEKMALQNSIWSDKIRFPLTEHYLTSHVIQQSQLMDQAKVFSNLSQSSGLMIEALKMTSIHDQNLFKTISGISKRHEELNLVFGLTDKINISLNRNLEIIKSGVNINWFDQLNITAKLINGANTAITSINEYFSEAISVDSIIEEDIESGVEEINEISENVLQSEEIIQDSAGTTLLLTTEYSQLIIDKIDKLDQQFQNYESLLNHLQRFIQPQSFSQFLDEYTQIVSREYWQQFWENESTLKPSPESIAKSNLAMFLIGRYMNIAFIGQELKSGPGFLDLLINILGINHLIELKLIGENISVGWAKSGVDQLNKYMKSWNLKESYLVVYDGRKTNKGEQLPEYYDVSNGRIWVKKIKIGYQSKSKKK